MGETERTFLPQEGPPNSLLNFLDGQVGSRLGEFSKIQVPTYDQERFENNIIILNSTKTGAGAAVFAYDLPGVPSYLVREVMIIGELGSPRGWSVESRKSLANGTAFDYERAVISLPAGNVSARLVGGEGTMPMNNAADVNEFHTSAPFVCWRGITGFTDEFFQVRTANITAAQVVSVHVVLEVVPNASQYRDMSSAVVIA